MSHEPPIPPGNQSPYPIVEPPHEHAATPPPVVASTSAAPRTLLVGGAIAAGVALVGGLTAFLFSRNAAPTPKRARRKA